MRLAALAAIALLLVVAAAVVRRLAVGLESPVPAAPAAPPPEDRVLGRQERVRHQEYRDGRPVADVRGDRFFRGPDGRDHLQGAIEIASLGPAGETVARLTAAEVVYDPGSLRFTISGTARVEAGGVVLEGDAYDYDRETGTFTTASAGRFSAKTMAGRAGSLSYVEAADEIRLGGGFRVDLAAGPGPGGTLTVSGESFRYSRRERRGRLDGRVEIEAAGLRAAARSAEIVARADETGFETAGLEGAARVVLAGAGEAGGPGGEIAAERIEIGLDRETGTARSVRTAALTVLTAASGTAGRTVVFAPALTATLGPDGRLAGWSASGGVRVEAARPEGPALTLEAEAASLDAGPRLMRLTGGPGRPAVAESSVFRLEAGSFVFGPGPEDLDAAGGVLCLFKAGGGGAPAGLFSDREAVSLSCDTAAFRRGAWSASSAGAVRAWQGDDFLTARELGWSAAASELTGRGGIEAGLTEAGAKDVPGRRIEAGGRELTLRSGSRVLVLMGPAYVRLPPAKLEAGTITAVLAPDGGGVTSLEASTGVVVSKDRYEGRSTAASYRSETRRLSLTGRPVLTDGKGGSARGAKLTFDLADDKISIENEGPERATTVVRS